MPRLASPLPNAQVPYAITFEWYPAVDAQAYVIQAADSENFAGPLLLNATTSERALYAELLVAGPLWWRVCAVDSRGIAGRWSAARRLNVVPPPLAASVAAVTLTPSSVAGGEASAGAITLDQPAPDGGATVFLASSETDLVRVPFRIIFPAGATAAAFVAETRPSARDRQVHIFAASKGDMRNATLTVGPLRPRARLFSLGVNPAFITAGSEALGTVALAGPARSTTAVRLAASDALRVLVPPAVVVPTGASSASFAVTTGHDNTPGEIVISASLDGVVKSMTLKLGGAATMDMLRPPSPLAPYENAAVGLGAPVEFSWSDVIGAATYTLEVDDSPAFDVPLVASRVLLAPRVSLSGPPPGVFWWRVRANDHYGAPGRWSQPRMLQVHWRQ